MKFLKMLTLLIAFAIFATLFMNIQTAAQDLPSVYVSQINKKVDYASGAIFTKAFTNSNTIKSSEGNFRWTKQIVCKPTDKPGVYELTQDTVGNLKNGTNGDPDESLTIPENGFIYAAHIDDRDTAKQDGTFESSKANQDKISNLKAGQKVTISGIDIETGTIQANAVIYIGDATEANDNPSSASSTSAPVSSTPSSTSSTPVSSTPTSSAPVSSTPSSASSSVTSSNQPETGDEGIFAVAIFAFTALVCTTALSLRKRRRS